MRRGAGRDAVRSPFRGTASRRGALLLLLLVPTGASVPPARQAVRVRVVERGSRRLIAGATVDRYVSEIRISDSWRCRIVGDDLLPREEESKPRPAPDVPGTASTWIGAGATGHAISDAAGIARFDESFEGGATLVASTPNLRGACVVDVKEGTPPPAEVVVELGPPRAVDVVVVGVDGSPRAGIPVEFGRFLDGARPRECGDDPESRDRCELWDRLGARVLSDERGRAKLTGLELHHVDDLDALRGAKASPFCARAVVLGRARVLATVDPDAPPRGPVTLKLPAIGSIDVGVELPDHTPLEVEGDLEVFAGKAALAPGFQRVVDVQRGRARLFPVEAGLEGRIGVRSQVCNDGTLTATTVQLVSLSEPVFGDDFLPTIESSCALPDAGGERIEVTLPLPITWFQVCTRLLDAARRPLASVEVGATLAADVTKSDVDSSKTTVISRELRCPNRKTTADGRVAFLMRRPLVPAALSIKLRVLAPNGAVRGGAVRPLALADDAWRIDLGDVVLDH